MSDKKKTHKAMVRERMRKDGFFDGRFAPKSTRNKARYRRPNKGSQKLAYLDEYDDHLEDFPEDQ